MQGSTAALGPVPTVWGHAQPCRPLPHPKILPLPGPPQALSLRQWSCRE